MKIARLSNALDYVWAELTLPAFDPAILIGTWGVEIITGALPDLSSRNHIKRFYYEQKDNPGIIGHNETDFFGKPRTWGRYKAIIVTGSDTAKLIYYKYGIVDDLKIITPRLILGRFNKPHDYFRGWFWLFKREEIKIPEAPKAWGDVTGFILTDDQQNIIYDNLPDEDSHEQ